MDHQKFMKASKMAGYEPDRDWPVPMDELRRASTEALLAPLKARADAMESEIVEELKAAGLALVDRARFERIREALLSIQHLSRDGSLIVHASFPGGEGEAYRRAFNHCMSLLQPGDLDPLP